MYRYSDAPHNNAPASVRPVSSLSSGSTDSGVYTVPQQSQGTNSQPVTGPPSPALQINHLLNQTANLLAVNARLRKEIEQVRSGGGAPPVGMEGQILPPPLLEAYPFDQHQNNNNNNNNTNNFQQQPSRPSSGRRSPKPDSYKTVMCQAWLESKVCMFAENCRFAHGEPELRPSKIQPKQNSKYKTKLCDKYTTTGLCPYGTRCLFIHPDNGNNSYIRPDKLVEVSQRHALAELSEQQANMARPVTPVNDEAALVPLGPTPTRGFGGLGAGAIGGHLRPHPSWPLEPPTFFREKNDEPVVQSKQTVISAALDMATPDRPSLGGVSGYVSGGSTPATDISPFSTVSSSSVNLHIQDDDRDFELFRLTGLDNLAEELTRNLELW